MTTVFVLFCFYFDYYFCVFDTKKSKNPKMLHALFAPVDSGTKNTPVDELKNNIFG